MLTIADCFKVRSLNDAAVHLINQIAFSHRRGYSRGIDGKTFWESCGNLRRTLAQLDRQLHRQTFAFSPCLKITRKVKNKVRDLYISTWTDRIVERWLNDCLNVLLHRWFAPTSYAYRAMDFGLDRCQRAVKRAVRRGGYVLRRDIRNYFNSINHDLLLGKLAELVDRHDYLYDLASQRIRFSYDDNQRASAGVPFGSSLACSLANIYLTDLDRLLTTKTVAYFRYADDFLLICKSADQARVASETFANGLAALRLAQKPSHRLDVLLSGPNTTEPVDAPGFERASRFKYLGLCFNANGLVSLSVEKQRKIFNLFRRSLEVHMAAIGRESDIGKRLAMAVVAVNEVVTDRIRSVAIVDYYLKHVDDEQQLQILDMRIAQLVISVVLGKAFRRRDFAALSYGRLRAAGLLSLVHRHRLLKHGVIVTDFLSTYNELTLRRYLGVIAGRHERINQARLRRKLQK